MQGNIENIKYPKKLGYKRIIYKLHLQNYTQNICLESSQVLLIKLNNHSNFSN